MAYEFRNDYWFLSNMYPAEFRHEGKHYRSVEHFYQSMKADGDEDEAFILEADTPKEARRRGRKIKIRKDWDEVKLVVMEIGLRLKFNHPYLRKKLLETGDEILVEGNSWGDRFWGVDKRTKKGSNHLGRLLMEIRASLRED